jgi:hypothetical protein
MKPAGFAKPAGFFAGSLADRAAQLATSIAKVARMTVRVT